MGNRKMPEDKKRSRTVAVRLTPAEYDWILKETKALSKELGFKVTMSSIATKLLREAMARA